MPLAPEKAVIMVPPIPILIPFPTVRIPTELSNTKSVDVAKSSDSLNKTLELGPGGFAVIVAILPALTPST